MLTFNDIRSNLEVQHYIDRADGVMESMGYTEHGRRHAGVVAKRARSIMEALGYPGRSCELADWFADAAGAAAGVVLVSLLFWLWHRRGGAAVER